MEDQNNQALQVKNRYDEVFNIEMDGWCYGIANYPGEVFPGLVHRVIKELNESFKEALEHYYAFNVLDISLKFSKSAKYLIHEKEVAFSILAQLPNPKALSAEGQYVLAQVIDPVEQKYGGAMERLSNKWRLENQLHEVKNAA